MELHAVPWVSTGGQWKRPFGRKCQGHWYDEEEKLLADLISTSLDVPSIYVFNCFDFS